MDKHQPFYGTPLIRSLKNEEADNKEISSYKSRKARLEYQQTVRDSEGRQRFHGAFTGGFSAGYFNTVDTKEGFKPKEFISHRRDRHGGASSRELAGQRPEDFMDEEDLGEFGIAPRKIRVNDIYSSKDKTSSNRDSLIQALQLRTETIGGKILRASTVSTSRQSNFPRSNDLFPAIKNNYHGIGYQPLRKTEPSRQDTSANPLVATLGQGKRIKISGEAFGSGVLEEDDDNYNYGSMNELYGIDDMKNYNFQQLNTASNRSKAAKSSSLAAASDENDHDDDTLPGFTLAKDLNSMSLSDSMVRYPRPQLPKDWIAPTRSKPYVPPVKESPDQELFLQRLKAGSTLGDKFTSAIKPHKSTDIDSRAGLLHYTDIKSSKTAPETGESYDVATPQTPIISRLVLEWRPCSTL